MSGNSNLKNESPNIRPSRKNNNNVEDVVSLEMTHLFMLGLKRNKQAKEGFSMIDLINTQLTQTRIKQIERIEQTLLCQCAEISSRYKNTHIDDLDAFCTQTFRLALFKKELVNNNIDVHESLTKFDEEEVASYEVVRCSLDVTVANKGENFDELNKRQQRRRLTQIKNRSQKSLSFLAEYRLSPKDLVMTSPIGTEYRVCFDADGQKRLEPENLRTLVGLMDRFCVSEAAYHELAQLYPNLPRTHTVINARRQMTATLNIERVPGDVNGALVSFRCELHKKLQDVLKENPDQNKVMVQLSMDGTHVSRISNYVVFSFRLVDMSDSCSADSIKTLAILNCREDYIKLKTSLQPLFEEINSVIEDGYVNVDDKAIGVKIVFCADMKMILTILGLGGISCNHACVWCLMHRGDRHNMEHPLDYFNSDDMKRNWQQMTEHAVKCEFGVQHTPLLKIEVEDYVLDELHLLLRITDLLERNLIDEVKTRDEEERTSKGQPTHMDKLVKSIKDCGVSFSFWQDKETRKLKWTSLNGQEKRKLLAKLPQTLKGKLRPNTEERVLRLWSLLFVIHTKITSPESVDAQEVFELSRNWVKIFLSLDKHLSGYNERNITPYVHCMVYHVPFMIQKFGTLRSFSCQAFEKRNDVIKKIHQRKSNKWDPTVEALQICKRMEESSKSTRDKRQYIKRKPEYWNEEIQQNRRAKRAKLDLINCQPVEAVVLESMNEPELRDYIEGKGIKTKARSRGWLLKEAKRLDI
ncbi:uncharacterized protein LOC124266631 [Haliotis rubra]|uniref:uncharacterized protein LOC124266631 n=1 Tax=Haliotis rubra TaxID=36100 RepID=UPI001EE629F0|nr:uncharacterized protein LOC124266631 [Haliotis rubra]XP_046557389.1 uncharacterized protein LOC124266631 [Haliotis rubra]